MSINQLKKDGLPTSGHSSHLDRYDESSLETFETAQISMEIKQQSTSFQSGVSILIENEKQSLIERDSSTNTNKEFIQMKSQLILKESLQESTENFQQIKKIINTSSNLESDTDSVSNSEIQSLNDSNYSQNTKGTQNIKDLHNISNINDSGLDKSQYRASISLQQTLISTYDQSRTHLHSIYSQNLNSNFTSTENIGTYQSSNILGQKSFFSHLSENHDAGDPNIVKKGSSYLLRLPKQKYIYASKKTKKNVQKINGVEDIQSLLEISSLLNKMCYVVTMNHINEENLPLLEQLELFQQQCWESELRNKKRTYQDDYLFSRIKKDSMTDISAPTAPTKTSSFQTFGNLNESGISESFSLRMHDIYQYQMETMKLQKMQK